MRNQKKPQWKTITSRHKNILQTYPQRLPPAVFPQSQKHGVGHEEPGGIDLRRAPKGEAQVHPEEAPVVALGHAMVDLGLWKRWKKWWKNGRNSDLLGKTWWTLLLTYFVWDIEKNKMKPTNPNADTYVEEQKQYL